MSPSQSPDRTNQRGIGVTDMNENNTIAQQIGPFRERWISVNQLIPNYDITDVKQSIENEHIASSSPDQIESILQSLPEGLAYMAWDKIRVPTVETNSKEESQMPIICFPVVCFCDKVLESIGNLTAPTVKNKTLLASYLISIGYEELQSEEMCHTPTRLFRFFKIRFDYHDCDALSKQFSLFIETTTHERPDKRTPRGPF